MRKLLFVAAAIFLLPMAASAARTAITTATTPVYADATDASALLGMVAVGTSLNVSSAQDGWLQVEFRDPELGPRIGWVRSSVVSVPGERPGAMDWFPRHETAVGWAFLHSSGVVGIRFTGQNMPLGWNVSTVTNLSPWLGIVGDIAGHYKRYDMSEDITDAHSYTTTMAGGVRVAVRRSSLVTPYAQFLAGYVRRDDWLSGQHFAHNNFGILPSGGLDVGAGRVAGRVELGIARVFYDGITEKQLRLVVGVVVRSQR